MREWITLREMEEKRWSNRASRRLAQTCPLQWLALRTETAKDPQDAFLAEERKSTQVQELNEDLYVMLKIRSWSEMKSPRCSQLLLDRQESTMMPDAACSTFQNSASKRFGEQKKEGHGRGILILLINDQAVFDGSALPSSAVGFQHPQSNSPLHSTFFFLIRLSLLLRKYKERNGSMRSCAC